MNFDLKKFLKQIKLNENSISMVLGLVVIVIVGILVANYFKGDSGEIATGTSTTQNGTAKEYLVIHGDTLWSIAEDNYGSGYNWVDISKANALTSDEIEVGQKLSLPEIAAKEPTSTQKAEVATVTNPTAISGNEYTVVKGDTLWNISVRAYGDGYKWTELAKANDLKNPNVIHAGNILTLPR